MPLRSCIVSYHDLSCTYSIEVVAETLHEAAVLGIKAMDVLRDRLHLLSLDVLVKPPEVHRSISGAALSAWLARAGKDAKEQALMDRLSELLRNAR
jgi:hypothetical protein